MKKSYSNQLKKELIAKMLPPNNESLTQLATDYQISIHTLRSWKKKFLAAEKITISTEANLTSLDKFAIVIETLNMSDSELTIYCHKKGIYPDEVKSWITNCKHANDSLPNKLCKLNEIIDLKNTEITQLRTELQRKEKALAETAALLVLHNSIV